MVYMGSQGHRQIFWVRGLVFQNQKLLIIHKHLYIFSADTIMAMATCSILHWSLFNYNTVKLHINFCVLILLIADWIHQ